MQDAIAALRWLHETAAALGGAAKRLTVWGQSPGGTMVQSLLFAPSARGLFAAAVSMSGSPRMNDTFATTAGPTDTAFLFDVFLARCRRGRAGAPAAAGLVFPTPRAQPARETAKKVLPKGETHSMGRL